MIRHLYFIFRYVWRKSAITKGWESKSKSLVDFTDGFRINCSKRGRARIRGVAVSQRNDVKREREENKAEREREKGNSGYPT